MSLYHGDVLHAEVMVAPKVLPEAIFGNALTTVLRLHVSIRMCVVIRMAVVRSLPIVFVVVLLFLRLSLLLLLVGLFLLLLLLLLRLFLLRFLLVLLPLLRFLLCLLLVFLRLFLLLLLGVLLLFLGVLVLLRPVVVRSFLVLSLRMIFLPLGCVDRSNHAPKKEQCRRAYHYQCFLHLSFCLRSGQLGLGSIRHSPSGVRQMTQGVLRMFCSCGYERILEAPPAFRGLENGRRVLVQILRLHRFHLRH